MDHKDVERLKQQPKAMQSLKNLLENGNMLNKANGDPVKFGVDNYKELESAYKQASQVDVNGNDVQNEEE